MQYAIKSKLFHIQIVSMNIFSDTFKCTLKVDLHKQMNMINSKTTNKTFFGW